MTLGDKIRKYRILKGLTQAQLGSMVKLTGDRIRQYENDVRKPKDGKLFEIADALDINPSTLAEPDFDDPTSVMHVLLNQRISMDCILKKLVRIINQPFQRENILVLTGLLRDFQHGLKKGRITTGYQ